MADDPLDPDLTRAFSPEDLEKLKGPGDELVGTVFADRYRILRCLGTGAMGAVYEAEHLKIGRRDAVKVLQASIARDPEATRRFLRGARNASLVRHPNVCTIYDFGETPDGLQFLAMEFVEGESLTDVIRRDGRLDPVRAVNLARQVAAGLQAAHDQEVVHRDLKPDNVMIGRGRGDAELVKVVDFDIARGASEGEGMSVTRTGFVVGTPEYMSPEQLTGDRLDGRSDLYSLGLLLFRMLSGSLPFKGDTAQELMVQRLTRDPLSLSDVAADHPFPPGMQEVLDRALARDRDERFPDVGAFSDALSKVVGVGDASQVPTTRAVEAPGEGTEGTPPPTRVASADEGAPTGSPAGSEAPATAVRTAGSSRGPKGWIAVAALAVVALGGLGAGGAYLVLSRDSGVEGAESTNGAAEMAAPGFDLETTEEEDPDARGADPDAAEVAAETTSPEASPGPETSEPTPREGLAQQEEASAPGPDPAQPGGIRLPDRASRSILQDQFLRLDETTNRPGLMAIRDTTQAVLARPGLNRADSAFAAFVMGSALIPLGDSLVGVDWLDEAVRLDPQRGYITLRDLHRRGPR